MEVAHTEDLALEGELVEATAMVITEEDILETEEGMVKIEGIVAVVMVAEAMVAEAMTKIRE